MLRTFHRTKMKAEIFTTPTCIKCQSLKNQLTGDNYALDVEYIDATIGDGAILAKERGVFAAPTVFLFNDDGAQIGIAHDIDEIENILDACTII